MQTKQFNEIIHKQIELSLETLTKKNDEYGTDDRLHAFKQAAELQRITPVAALGGMMCKHTVSVYDLINKHEAEVNIPIEMWNEKITDHINYLLLLKALVGDNEN